MFLRLIPLRIIRLSVMGGEGKEIPEVGKRDGR